MSPMIRLTVDDEARFPRVSGDEPVNKARAVAVN